MNREELHAYFNQFFPNSKHFLLHIFDVDDGEIIKEVNNLSGYKIPIRFKDKELREKIERLGLTESQYYNAFLNILIEKYRNLQNIQKELEEWKEKNIALFV